MRKHIPQTKYYSTYSSSGSDTGPEAFVTPQGGRRSSTSSPSAHVTCALRRPTAWREVGGGCHLSSLWTQLPSQTEPGGLILALSALALSLSAKIFFMAHNKALCSSLAGYHTKAQQGQDEHKPERETHQREEPHGRGSTRPQPLVNMSCTSTSQSSQKGHMVASFLQLLLYESSVGWCHQQVPLLLHAWGLQFTLSPHPCLTKPTSLHISGFCFLS